MKKHNKKKIGLGSVVKAKVGELEEITMEVRSRIIRKKVVECVHDAVGNNKFLFKFKYGPKK